MGGGGGGVQVNPTKKKADSVFLVLRSQMVNSKENYHFYLRGGGGGQSLFLVETHITCDFPRGSRPPVPPLEATTQKGISQYAQQISEHKDL